MIPLAIRAAWSAIPWQVKLGVAALVGGIILLRVIRARAAAKALAEYAAAYAEDRARRTEAGRKAADREMRETRDAEPEDIVRRIRERNAKWD